MTVTHASSEDAADLYIYKYYVKATLFTLKRSRVYRCNISGSLQWGNFLYKRWNASRRREAEHIYTDAKSICPCRIYYLDDAPLCNWIPHPCEYLLTCMYNVHSTRTVQLPRLRGIWLKLYLAQSSSHLQNMLLNRAIREKDGDESFALIHFGLKNFILLARYAKRIRDWMN